jgi:SAM-dependent methyltransferase
MEARLRSTSAWDAVDPYAEPAVDFWIKLEHVGRYLLAADVARRYGARRILDVASGTGYGTALLAELAEPAVADGVDADADIVETAQARYGGDRVRFYSGDAATTSLRRITGTSSYDLVVSFESLEHVPDAESFLAALAEALRPRGTIVLSTPRRAADPVDANGFPRNAHHRRLFGQRELLELVRSVGLHVEYMLGQPVCAQLRRRERLLSRGGRDRKPLAERLELDRAAVLECAELLAYPQPSDLDESYSSIVVATR